MTSKGNRIVGFDPTVDPMELTANPHNHRIHPERQQSALRAALDEIGWIDAVIVNRHTGYVVDGHARVLEAMDRECTVPVLYVELDPDEERKAIATFDAIGDLAGIDQAMVAAAIAEVHFEHDILAEVLGDMLPSVSDDSLPDAPPETPVVWGYVSWGQSRRIDSTESEVTLLDAAYESYVEREGDDKGFVRWLVERRED